MNDSQTSFSINGICDGLESKKWMDLKNAPLLIGTTSIRISFLFVISIILFVLVGIRLFHLEFWKSFLSFFTILVEYAIFIICCLNSVISVLPFLFFNSIIVIVLNHNYHTIIVDQNNILQNAKSSTLWPVIKTTKEMKKHSWKTSSTESHNFSL